MYASRTLLGSTIVTRLQAQRGAEILVIGADRYHRSDLARVECFNFLAAQNLSTAIRDLRPRVRDTVDLFERIAPKDLIRPRVGAIAIAVLGAAFEAHGIGGESPLDAWAQHHVNGGGVVTVGTLKERERRAALKDRPPSRNRKDRR